MRGGEGGEGRWPPLAPKLVQTNPGVKRSRPKPSPLGGSTCPGLAGLDPGEFHTGFTNAVLRPYARGYSAQVVTQ
ncbi:hypothetical protein SHJG_6105 [Streptomyces hygroscopicus subsp. jinggangensis 5008]|nr:hypothetical protein SHJG_6105 [Streptomyces hygroscopicus subsp. jinggangensis 5008]AGF65530.1 hypothetical protein SHJGH_5867 [Streptomyces hygroscopicus subsp. jinggangensis TL01]